MSAIRLPAGTYPALFNGLKAGDIKSVPKGNLNINALRNRAYMMNTAYGYNRYSISYDRLTDSIRIACASKKQQL